MTSAVVTSSLVTSSLVTSSPCAGPPLLRARDRRRCGSSRGAAELVLLVLLTVVMSLGIATRACWAPRHRPRFVTAELHRTLSPFTVALLGLHVVTAILDSVRDDRLGCDRRPVPFALPPARHRPGHAGRRLRRAVLLTSVLRARLGFRSWRAVHWLAYLAWPTAFVHALTAANDMRTGWVAATIWGSAAVLAAAVLARMVQARMGGAGRRARVRKVLAGTGPPRGGDRIPGARR